MVLIPTGLRKIAYNPERLMRQCFEKMIRASGINQGKAFILWRVWHLAKDKNAAIKARKKVAAANIEAVIDKKRRNHLRSGVRPLAKGVANTKMQNKIFNRMYFIAFGRLKNAFRDWTECLEHMAKALNEKRAAVCRRLALSACSKHQLAFMYWKNWVTRELK